MRTRNIVTDRVAGWTLLEVSFYATLALVVGAQVSVVTRVATRSASEADALNRTFERSRSALNYIANDVRQAIASTVVVDSTGRQLTLTLAGGFDGVAVLPGPPIRYDLETMLSETANGVDDNGNGLVDEGRLVCTNLSTGEAIPLCGGIDLGPSRFTLAAGGAVSVSLRVSAGAGGIGDVMVRTKRLTVTPRN